ncbi:MAG: nitroreductase/quinone reductase family protein [Actinomycetota bacterium]
MSDWNESTIAEFRANEGRVGGMFEKMTLLLLHTTGQRTGQERVNPLAYMADEDRWIVFASKGGHVFHPHWLHNLEANPAATIEVGTETIRVTATILREGPERDELWRRQVAARPQFGEYEAKAGGRTIPVIVLRRAG